MSRRTTALVGVAAVLAGVTAMGHGTTPAAASQGMRYTDLSKLQQKLLSSSALRAYAQAGGADSVNFDAATTTAPKHYYPTGDDGCASSLGADVRTAQNCLNITDPDLQGRGQAQNETSIAANPSNGKQLVGSWNDYRRGDGNCYGSYSRDGGHSWVDTTVPQSFTRGTNFTGAARQYWQAGGDTSVAWDTKGNAYMSCQVFNRGAGASQNPDLSSAFYVFRSTGNGGASWDFPGRAVAEQQNSTGNTVPLLDKQLITVDNHPGSPFQDRVYVTYTLFAADNTAYIYAAHSNDYGQTFSAPVLVSNSSALCPNSVSTSGNCDANQFSQPFTGADGALYVAYDNFNNSLSSSTDNHNQVLLSKSTDGGVSFGAPVLVSNYYDLPDCATYQSGADPGRACVPEKGPGHNSFFRATNYPSGAVDPTTGKVVVTFGSYINKTDATNCTSNGFAADFNNAYNGVKSTCDNKILLSESGNGGASFNSTDPTTGPLVSAAPSQATSDQFWQWAAFSSTGKLAVSYYDRQYGSDENTGFSDVTLTSGLRGNMTNTRVTTASSPPPTAFSGVFWGDYSGLAVTGNNALPIWSDTRNPDLFICPGTGIPGTPPSVCKGSAINASVANTEEVYTRVVSLP